MPIFTPSALGLMPAQNRASEDVVPDDASQSERQPVAQSRNTMKSYSTMNGVDGVDAGGITMSDRNFLNKQKSSEQLNNKD